MADLHPRSNGTRPSPVAAAEVAGTRKPTQGASLLPPRVYHDPDILSYELEEWFAKGWIFVGREEEIELPGQYFLTRLCGENLIIVHDKDETIRGFFNVCRHHAAAVVTEPEGCAQHLRCPYHGWTYGLDGALKGTPDFTGVLDFDRSSQGLVPMDTDVWEGWVFVRLASDGPALRDFLGDDLTGQVRQRELARDARARQRRHPPQPARARHRGRARLRLGGQRGRALPGRGQAGRDERVDRVAAQRVEGRGRAALGLLRHGAAGLGRLHALRGLAAAHGQRLALERLVARLLRERDPALPRPVPGARLRRSLSSRVSTSDSSAGSMATASAPVSSSCGFASPYGPLSPGQTAPCNASARASASRRQRCLSSRAASNVVQRASNSASRCWRPSRAA